MSYRMEIYSNRDDYTAGGFDVSELAHNITYTTSLDGSAGKLTFTLEKDPNGILILECGYTVKFYVTNENLYLEKIAREKDSELAESDYIMENVFTGYIFTLGTDRTEAYKVVAYDILRYLKNHYTISFPNGKVSLHDVFEKLCASWKIEHEDRVREFTGGLLGDLAANYLPQKSFNDVTLFDILSWCMTTAGQGEYDYGFGVKRNSIAATVKGNKEYSAEMDRDFYGACFFLKSEGGKLILTEVTIEENLIWNDNPVIIGDESLLTNYEYELSIDKNTYNQVILVKDGEEKTDTSGKKTKEKVVVSAKQDDETIKRWGVLSRTVNIKDGSTKEQIEEYLNLSLQSGNKISKTLKLNAIGFPLYAGSTFVFDLKKLRTKCKCYVLAATHNYDADKHTMQLEVSTNPKMLEIL